MVLSIKVGRHVVPVPASQVNPNKMWIWCLFPLSHLYFICLHSHIYSFKPAGGSSDTEPSGRDASPEYHQHCLTLIRMRVRRPTVWQMKSHLRHLPWDSQRRLCPKQPQKVAVEPQRRFKRAPADRQPLLVQSVGAKPG